MDLQAILFDLDGTLGNTLPIVVQALQETLFLYSGREYTPLEIAAMFGPAEEGVIRPRVPEADYPAALRHYLDRYAALHELAVEPFPGVIAMLDRLGKKGIRRGVVTGKGSGTAEISMRSMGLSPYIDALETGSEAGAEKPAAIRRVLDGWGIAPDKAAYVGDMPYDMQAAREAGLLALGAAWAATATVKEGDGAVKIFDTVEALMGWITEVSSGETHPSR